MVTEEFEAKDSLNRVYIVVVLQKPINTGSLDGPGQVMGLKEFRLLDGRALNRVSDTTFKIVENGTLIERF